MKLADRAYLSVVLAMYFTSDKCWCLISALAMDTGAVALTESSLRTSRPGRAVCTQHSGEPNLANWPSSRPR